MRLMGKIIRKDHKNLILKNKLNWGWGKIFFLKKIWVNQVIFLSLKAVYLSREKKMDVLTGCISQKWTLSFRSFRPFFRDKIISLRSNSFPSSPFQTKVFIFSWINRTHFLQILKHSFQSYHLIERDSLFRGYEFLISQANKNVILFFLNHLSWSFLFRGVFL